MRIITDMIKKAQYKRQHKLVSENTKWKSQRRDAYLPQDFENENIEDAEVNHKLGHLRPPIQHS